MIGKLKTVLGFSLVIFIFLLQGCANKYTIKPGDSLKVAYRKAMALYTSKKYDGASQAFQTVLSLGRGTGYGKEAQYYLAESYYKDKQYLLAANEFKHYYTFYPTDIRRTEVQYMEAMSYYKLSPPYNLDQSYTNQAIDLFQLFIANHPNSDLSTKAGHLIDQMRGKLAHKMVNAGNLYLRNREYKAAALYYGLTMDNYPETNWAETALAKQIHAYLLLANNSVPDKQKERYSKAIAAYQQFIQLFPKGKNRLQAENYYSQAQKALDKLNKVSKRQNSSSK